MSVTIEQMAEALKHMMTQQSQLNEMIANLVKVQTEGASRTPSQENKGKPWHDLDVYRNVKAFAGDQKDWEEFHGKLKGQIAAKNAIAAEVLDIVEAKMSEAELEVDVFPTVEVAGQEMDDDDLREIRNRMFNILLNLTTGEANAVVRRCRGRCGLLAWKKLCTTLNPRTLASGVKLISQVLNPAKITDARKADVAIEMWDDKLVKLSTEYGERLSDKLKVAVLYGMLPKDLQERALDKCAINWDQTKESDATTILTKIKEEVKNVAKSRRDMITPRPMEVDQVAADEEEQEYHEYDMNHEGDLEVNFVGKGGGNYNSKGFKGKGKGKGACFTCGEHGHRAAECPKGQGKGMKGKGNGSKGWSTWTNPSQNSMARACFGCGSTAHLYRECPSNPNRQVQEVTLDEPEVLFIGRVEVGREQEKGEDGWEVQKKGRKGPDPSQKVLKPPGLEMPNRFGALTNEEDEEEVQCQDCYQHVAREVHGCRNLKSESRPKSKRVYHVMAVHEDKKKDEWLDLGVGEITVDSAAEESCWPKELGGAFETRPSKRTLVLKTANGGEMQHYGEKQVTFRGPEAEDIIGLKFQVTDVRKPLLSVRRLTEKGNTVQFSDEPGECYILNKATGKKIPMEKRGASFIIKARFVKAVGCQGFPRQEP
jgi:hypothetical protein